MRIGRKPQNHDGLSGSHRFDKYLAEGFRQRWLYKNIHPVQACRDVGPPIRDDDFTFQLEFSYQAENFVEAYDLYSNVAAVFAGDELGKKAADPLKKLVANKAVKDELAARQMYEQLCDGTGRARPQQRETVAEFAATIAKRYPKAPTGEKCAELAKELVGVQ